MNTQRRLSWAVLVVGSLCTGAVLAGDRGAGKEGEHGKGSMAMVDTDKDGKVSSAEYLAHSQKMFTRADANKDGKVTAEEMDAAHKAMRKEHGKQAGMEDDDMKRRGMDDDHRGWSSTDMIKKMDTDGDGALTLAEHSAGAQRMFSDMDTNKDGSLTDAEMKSAHKGKKKMSAMREE